MVLEMRGIKHMNFKELKMIKFLYIKVTSLSSRCLHFLATFFVGKLLAPPPAYCGEGLSSEYIK